jgi:ABC-2 type transport system ATP-binding protein
VVSVELKGVHRTFGPVHALENVDLAIHPGITALLGVNGAGKTTLMRILTGVLEPTSGELVLGSDAVGEALRRRELGRHVGYMPQTILPVPGLNAGQYLRYVGFLKSLKGKDAKAEAARVLELVDLAPKASTATKALSGGMLRRLGLAAALVGSPTMIVLDEPMAGLDVEQRTKMRSVIREAAADAPILLSTHLAEDVADIGDRVCVLHEGRVRYDGTLTDFADAPIDGRAVERAFLSLVAGGVGAVRSES